MALIECPECGRRISDKAAACPQCGCPNQNRGSADLSATTGLPKPSAPASMADPVTAVVGAGPHGNVRAEGLLDPKEVINALQQHKTPHVRPSMASGSGGTVPGILHEDKLVLTKNGKTAANYTNPYGSLLGVVELDKTGGRYRVFADEGKSQEIMSLTFRHPPQGSSSENAAIWDIRDSMQAEPVGAVETTTSLSGSYEWRLVDPRRETVAWIRKVWHGPRVLAVVCFLCSCGLFVSAFLVDLADPDSVPTTVWDRPAEPRAHSETQSRQNTLRSLASASFVLWLFLRGRSRLIICAAGAQAAQVDVKPPSSLFGQVAVVTGQDRMSRQCRAAVLAVPILALMGNRCPGK